MKNFFGCMMIMILMVWAPVAVSAQESPNVFTYQLGSVEICLLSEGQATGNSSIFVGASPEMIQKCLPEGTYPRSCNAFLIRTPDKNILVDTGYGRMLFENLKLLGVTPEQIDAILITHAHGDHLGGMILEGKAAFSNAELYFSQPEYDYCMNGDDRNEGARKMIEAYKSKLRLFQPNEIDVQPDKLFPGIYAIAAYGHTAGHTLYMVESGSEKILIWGDLTHAMAIQMPYPQVAMTYDTDTDKAIAARKKVLEYVAKNNIPVAGMHTAFPGIGRITKTSDGGFLHEPVK